MIQSLFIGALYILGVAFGLLLQKHIPPVFIAITGFLWGAALWVTAAVVCLVLPLPFTLTSMTILFGLVVIVIAGVHLRRSTWRLDQRNLLTVLSILVLLCTVALISAHLNYSAGTPDSVVQIMISRVLAYDGITDWVSSQFAQQGVFFVSLQAASVFIDDAYLWSLQPVFGIAFILTFVYLSQMALSDHVNNRARIWTWVGITVFALMIGTFLMRFQMVYIHTNFPSGIYLFVAVSAFWIAFLKRNHAWIIIGMMALTAFSFLRTEAPLYGLIFLSLVVSNEQLTYRKRLYVALPYCLIVGLWYTYLFVTSPNSKILNSDRILLVLVTMVVFGGGVALTGFKRLGSRVLPMMPYLMLLALVMILGLTFVQKPLELKHSFRVMVDNMLFAQWWHETWASNWWGVTWFSVLMLTGVAALLLPRIPHEKLFGLGIPGFFALLFDFILVRNPYRSGWGDSGNRMLVHILPLVFFYLMIKYYRGLAVSEAQVNEFVQRRRAYLLVALSGALFVFIIRYAEILL